MESPYLQVAAPHDRPPNMRKLKLPPAPLTEAERLRLIMWLEYDLKDQHKKKQVT